MDNQDHKPARPNFLRRGPGLLDLMYNAWRKATEILEAVRHNNTPTSTQKSDITQVETPSERHHN